MPFFFVDDSHVKVPTQELWQSRGLTGAARIAPVGTYPHVPDWSNMQAMAQYQAISESPDQQQPQLKLQQGLKAVDVMSSPVITLQANQTLKDALTLVAQHDFRHVPIVSDQQKIVGIVSERDILRWMDRHPSQSWGDFYNTPITSVMISNVLTVTEDTDVREVAHLMSNKSVGSLPVIHQDAFQAGATLQGIITKSDLYTLIIDAVIYDKRV
jgi:hypothetical protein